MKKVLTILFFLLASKIVYCQHLLKINFTGKDSLFNTAGLKLQTTFASATSCGEYISKLPVTLQSKGFPAASVDEVRTEPNSTTAAIYLGRQYHWIILAADSINEKALKNSGFDEEKFNKGILNFSMLQEVQQRLLSYYENNGYPFSQAVLQDISLVSDTMKARLNIQPGVLYKIDSIRVFGKIKIHKKYLNRYFEIPDGSLYNREKVQLIGRRIAESEFMQEQAPNDVTLLRSGAVVNLYLEPRKTNTINFLLGFLPADDNTGKLRITGDANLTLRNAMARGETILFSFQSLQPKSPRLNLGYQHPFIFNSPFGIDLNFNLFKKDSSFLNISGQAGVHFAAGANQQGKLFTQWQNIFLLANGVDTNFVKATRQLPPNIDVNSTSIGAEYEWIKTNYRFNPVKGNEIKFTGIAGLKKIKPNADIVSLNDGVFNYASLYDSIKKNSYQLRLKLVAAHYFPVGKKATVKTAVNTGAFLSPDIFRNELFQIGGNRLMRGFDEEGIYATQYAVFTAEYRSLTGLNSYLYSFIDAGLVKNKFQQTNTNYTLASIGLGLLFDTKRGLLNVSYALGKRNDVPFSLRNASKIHIGYLNYF